MTARWPWILLLLVLAGFYYGSYVRHGIGFRDEGQTVALGAQRLLAGELPLKDVVLNYNVLWFYPVTGLFDLFGVNYVLLRGYCFALSTLTAVLGFLLVVKGTRRPWLGFLFGVVLVLIPGSTFKNYIPLLAVANTLCLLHVTLTPRGERSVLWKAALGGLVLGLTYLIRIDVALLITALWLGMLLLRLLPGETPFLQRAGLAIASLLLVAGITTAVHWPVWADAKRRGFDKEFAGQYHEKWRMLEGPVRQLLHGKKPANATLPSKPLSSLPAVIPVATLTLAATAAPATELAPAKTAAPASDKKTLQRASLKDGEKEGQNSGFDFLFLMYAPVFTVAVLTLAGLITLALGVFRGEEDRQQRGLAMLVLMGGALSTFPQFFFFRPDIPHLSEFMPGFLTASAAAFGLWWTGAKSWRDGRLVFTAFFLISVGVYVYNVLPDRWAGTWTIQKKRTKWFEGENGVRVFVSSREYNGLTEIQKILHEHAPNPKDYVVCYPYSPGINLLSNRPTYERNVYVDNAMRSSRWDDVAIANFQRHQPAAIVLSDWDINGSDASRFSVWAVKTKTWIQTNYFYQGSYTAGSDTFEVYTRTLEPPGQTPP